MPKICVATKIAPDDYTKLERLRAETGLTLSALIADAVAVYLGRDSEIGDRLAKVESELALLRDRLQ